MNLSTILVANAGLSLFFGLSLLVIPHSLFRLFGFTIDPSTLYLGRLFGASLLGYGVMLYMARRISAHQNKGEITTALFVVHLCGLAAALVSQLANSVTALCWLLVIIYFGLTGCYGYIRYFQKS